MARHPLPSITNVFRVAFNWVHTNGQTAANVMHFRAPSLNTGGVATAIDTNVTANMWAMASLNAHVESLSITPLDGTGATLPYPVTGSKWAGTVSASIDFVPDAACVVSLRTAKRGRRYRGRVYIPFQCESQIANGVITGSLTVTANDWTAFLANMATASCRLVVATYGHGLVKTPGVYPPAYTETTWSPDATDVATAVVESILGTQRRRQGRLR